MALKSATNCSTRANPATECNNVTSRNAATNTGINILISSLCSLIFSLLCSLRSINCGSRFHRYREAETPGMRKSAIAPPLPIPQRARGNKQQCGNEDQANRKTQHHSGSEVHLNSPSQGRVRTTLNFSPRLYRTPCLNTAVPHCDKS